MGYCNKGSLADYLDLANPQDLLRAIVCPFAQGDGLGIGVAAFAIIVWGVVGLALTVKVRHPAPIVITGLLLGGTFALALPGVGARILAIVVFVGLSGLGLWLYQRAQSSL